MNNNGVLHNQIKMFNKNMSHYGLDIAVSPRATGKSSFQLELRDFDLLNKTYIASGSEFPQSSIVELFDAVITKYFETNKSVEQSPEVSEIKVNGKVISAIRKVGEKHEVVTVDPNPSEELSNSISKIIELKGAADLKLNEQVIKCADTLRIGTLDMPKGSKELYVHTKNGAEKMQGKIKREQLIATLWFISKAYTTAPSFRKALNVSVTDGKHTFGYKDGKPFVDQTNLSEMEKQIVADLMTIKE
jgi:hypothetical protein